MASLQIYRVNSKKIASKVSYLENEIKSGIWQSLWNLKDPVKDYRDLCEKFHEPSAAYHIIQSFSHTDPVDPETVHKMGRELVESCFKDHLVMWSTHSNTPFLHNHLLVSARDRTGNLLQPDLKKLKGQIEKQNDEIAKRYGCSLDKKKGLTVAITSYEKELAEEKEASLKDRYLSDLADLKKECASMNEFFKGIHQKGYFFEESANGALYISDGVKRIPEKALDPDDQITGLELFFKCKRDRIYELYPSILQSANPFSVMEEIKCLELLNEIEKIPGISRDEINQRYGLILEIRERNERIEFLNRKDYQYPKDLFIDQRNKKEWKKSIENQYEKAKAEYKQAEKDLLPAGELAGLRNEANRLFFILGHIEKDLHLINEVIEEQKLIEPIYLRGTIDLEEIEKMRPADLKFEIEKPEIEDELLYFIDDLRDYENKLPENFYDHDLLENREIIEILEIMR